jgi:hypothetical protein
MSRASSWLRIGAGVALLVGLVPRAGAWDLFHRSHGDCNAQTVQIPAQQVVVETSRPRVVVQDTRPLRVSAAPAMVASFFVPMPMNLGAVGLASSSNFEERASIPLDFSALDAAHELERSQARVTAHLAIQEAQRQHIAGVMERVRASAAAAIPPAAAARTSTSSTCCDDLKTQLDNLNNRVERLELLVLTHDKAMRDPNVKRPDPAK